MIGQFGFIGGCEPVESRALMFLRRAKPAHLLTNLYRAAQLGLTLPPSLIVRADRVIG